ncbi:MULTISPECIES: hypothetical protein [Cyanophyceae]|uniref:hypothetical protein n=1 Tax=Cyanophyceae TaxID=3028117 RepID=UPI0016846BBB|nr:MULTISPECIES: hypothetical protein [Cyanophyceae]MBD1918364.1 hypothetical protein [Phormidium sp. FACHB-77]MBD2028767.1 hypothetical protein [Phormidium sp. FACHB-322]MBD2051188.1 hypothetical protein [Leptolyngbya sp. FACHB-60]
MAKLDPSVIEDIFIRLGYPSDGVILLQTGYASDGLLLLKRRLEEEYSQATIDRVSVIFDELDEIDEQKKEARQSSMAGSTSHTKLNWKLHLQHLNCDGHTLLEELARRVNLPIYWSKYSPAKRHTTQYQ